MREPRVFGHRERTAEVRPVADVVGQQVVDFRIHRVNHGGKPLHVGEREVPEQFHGIERRELFRDVGVELLHLAGTEYLGVVLVVVRNERLDLLVLLRLLHRHVIVGAVAQVPHVHRLVELVLALVESRKPVLRLRELDFTLHVFLHGESELVAEPREVRLRILVGELRVAVLRGDGVELFLVEPVEKVVQKPDARDVLGAGRRPRDAHHVALVLVVGAREVELVHVLEHVEVVLERVHVVPVILERERIQDRLPAAAQLP